MFLTTVLKQFNVPKILKMKSRREKSLVLAALFTAVTVLTVKFIVNPIFETQEQIREEIPVKLKQLEKYHQFIAEKSRFEENLKSVKALSSRSMAKLLAGDTAPLAAANLQDILKTLSAKNQIAIKSEKVLNPIPNGSFEQIPVQIEFMSSITNLTNFLYDMEAYDKLLVPTDLDIRVINRRNPQDISVVIVVAGLMQANKEKPGKT
jgi:type II secretory pathway component PulM